MPEKQPEKLKTVQFATDNDDENNEVSVQINN